MEGTKPKSIFDIPKPVEIVEVKPKPKRRRAKRKRKPAKTKTARAGGVEVSQKRNVRGQKQITLKHKGGLTQEITIHTGDQKPRGAKAKGQTASWNMKPAKFKASRGLRDNRVYLEPPKREYFGNRYKSALDQIRVNQKIAEAGQSKNKEIADVRDTARQERRLLEQREKAKGDTISELRREKAGLVASYNVSQRNQSKATILGGDVGELNKLIARRGFGAVRTLVVKGEIADDSTILQLDLSQQQIEKLLRLRGQEQSEYVAGKSYVFTTPKGIIKQGKFISETANFVRLEKPDGSGTMKVPKDSIVSGRELERVRSQSRDPSVRRGASLPRSLSVEREEFGSPRRRTASEEREVPEWTRTHARRRDAKPRTTGRAGGGFEFAELGEFTESTTDDEGITEPRKPKAKKPPREKSPEAKEELRLVGTLSRDEVAHVRHQLEAIVSSGAEEPFGARPEPQPEPQAVEEEEEDVREPTPEPADLLLAHQLKQQGKEGPLTGGLQRDPSPERAFALELDEGAEEKELLRQQFLEGGEGGGGTIREAPPTPYGIKPKMPFEEIKRGTTPRRVREATPDTQYFTEKQLNAESIRRGEVAIVDNRKDQKRSVTGTKRGVERPVKKFSVADVKSVIRSVYGDLRAGQNLEAKLDAGARQHGNIWINDKKVLNALGFPN